MAKYACDTCRHAKPVKREYYSTADGREWQLTIEYVNCAVRKPMWTVEKRRECWDYREAR